MFGGPQNPPKPPKRGSLGTSKKPQTFKKGLFLKKKSIFWGLFALQGDLMNNLQGFYYIL